MGDDDMSPCGVIGGGGTLDNLISSAQICSLISSALGVSDSTQSSSMATSWHTGHALLTIRHCSRHGQQKLWAHDNTTSDRLSMQMMHSSSSRGGTGLAADELSASAIALTVSMSIDVEVLQPLSSLRMSALMCISKVRKTDRNCFRFSRRYCSMRLGCNWTLTQAMRTVAFQKMVVSVPFFSANTNW